MNHKLGLIFILLILVLIASACGGDGSNLTYKVMGTASKAKVAYRNAKGETETESVSLPWETDLSIGGSFDFEVAVENEDESGSVTCEIWINDRRVGGTSGVRVVECSGSFSGSKNSFSTNYRGRYDAAPEDAVTTTTEQDEMLATSAAALKTRQATDEGEATPIPTSTRAVAVTTLAPITDFESYEHHIDCSVYHEDLKLRSFSVLYPSGSVIEDCAENPENYVAFGLDPTGDTEDPAFAVALGRFNFEPPDRSTYISNGSRLLGILGSQMESQYQAEKIDDESISYQGEMLFRNDFVAEIKGVPRLVRLVTIPNFDHGNSVLFFATQKIDGTPEGALPEFDQVTRKIIESFEFAPVETMIGDITFATDITEDSEPIDPGTSFPAGITKVYGVFEYADIFAGMEFEYAWYADGERVYGETISWGSLPSSGKTWSNFFNDAGMPPGTYELQLSINGELLQTGSFVVEGISDAGMDANAWYNQGFEHFEQGDYEEAIAAFSKAIELDPNHAVAYNDRGVAYMNLGELTQAMADFNRAIELDPAYATAYNSRGEAYRLQGDPKRAIADFDQAIVLDSDYVIARSNRCRAYRLQGDLDRAIIDCDQAIALDPDYASAYFERGVAYYFKEEWDLAITDYDQAIALNPAHAVSYLNRGVVYYVMGELDHAIADFSQAIELQPSYDQAYANRGFAHADQGDTDSAIADFRKVLEVSNNPSLRQKAEEQLQAFGAEP